jgi:hypothetical protein
MKTDDYEKLKKLCDDNGFELVTESLNENDKLFLVKKKPERVKVECIEFSSIGYRNEYSFIFVLNQNKKFIGFEVRDYLIQQLEQYLNNEL